jgi:hypothetical protein
VLNGLLMWHLRSPGLLWRRTAMQGTSLVEQSRDGGAEACTQKRVRVGGKL